MRRAALHTALVAILPWRIAAAADTGTGTVRGQVVIQEWAALEERTQPLANAVVFLSQAPEGSEPYAAPKQPQIVELHGDKITPRIALLRTGQKVRLKNTTDDPLYVRWYPRSNRQGYRVVAPHSATDPPIRFEKDESGPFPVLRIGTHDVFAHWLVLDHPFVAVTDSDGEFTIEGLPPGWHAFRVWHARAGVFTRSLARVEAGKTAKIRTILPGRLVAEVADRWPRTARRERASALGIVPGKTIPWSRFEPARSSRPPPWPRKAYAALEETSLKGLARDLESKERWRRVMAAKALASEHDPRRAAPLLMRLAVDDDRVLRAIAMRRLWTADDEDAQRAAAVAYALVHGLSSAHVEDLLDGIRRPGAFTKSLVSQAGRPGSAVWQQLEGGAGFALVRARLRIEPSKRGATRATVALYRSGDRALRGRLASLAHRTTRRLAKEIVREVLRDELRGEDDTSLHAALADLERLPHWGADVVRKRLVELAADFERTADVRGMAVTCLDHAVEDASVRAALQAVFEKDSSLLNRIQASGLLASADDVPVEQRRVLDRARGRLRFARMVQTLEELTREQARLRRQTEAAQVQELKRSPGLAR